jgi:sugar lactone lactonase YvrE
MKKLFLTLIPIALIVLALPTQSTIAGDKPFPKIIPTLAGSQPEGFAIGKRTTAFNGSPDGSIYKFNLRTGQGDVFVPVQDPEGCSVLGMRVDPRTNYLFVAGCVNGNALVYDADNGALIMEYRLATAFTGVVNDLTITRDAVYFTDSYRPVLYRLPLSKGGGIPSDSSGVTEIPLPAEFELDFPGNEDCCGGNGIVATPNGKTLIVGHSALSRLYRVDPATGDVDQISVDAPLAGFLDGIVMKGRTLYIMTPFGAAPGDGIQVVKLEKGLLSGKLVDVITDPGLDGVASGAIFGNSLYVNNARYGIFPPLPDTEYWVTKLRIRPIKK